MRLVTLKRKAFRVDQRARCDACRSGVDDAFKERVAGAISRRQRVLEMLA